MSSTSPTFLPRPSSLSLRWSSKLGLAGACLYIAGFALPLPWNIPLIILALTTVLVIAFGSRHSSSSWSPLTVSVLVLLASMGLSIMVSEDISRSLRLSTSLLPAILLFLLVAENFDSTGDTRLLYCTVSAVALGLAVVLLWAAWPGYNGKGLLAPISHLGIPILVVPNDLTFLAVVAPLSLVLLYREPRGVIGILAAISILLSMCAICVFRSRTAVLTIVLCLTCTSILVSPRQRLARRLAGVFALLLLSMLINALLFPDSQLLTKFVRNAWTLSGRVAYWSTAWSMFLDAPLLGKGPHTFGLFHRDPWAHNLYLEVLAEQGILGFAALGFLLVSGVFAAWKIRQTATAEVRLFGAGALAGLIGFCVAGGAELTLLREWVVTTLFMFLGIIAHLVSLQTNQGRVS